MHLIKDNFFQILNSVFVNINIFFNLIHSISVSIACSDFCKNDLIFIVDDFFFDFKIIVQIYYVIFEFNLPCWVFFQLKLKIPYFPLKLNDLILFFIE